MLFGSSQLIPQTWSKRPYAVVLVEYELRIDVLPLPESHQALLEGLRGVEMDLLREMADVGLPHSLRIVRANRLIARQ